MNRFVIGAALAVALGLGTSNKADAQIVYGYSAPAPNGTIQTAGTVITPWAYQNFNNYYSPFTGATMGQTYTANAWGMGLMNNYGYNPWGYRYSTGFYQPNYYANPYYGYNFGYIRRR